MNQMLELPLTISRILDGSGLASSLEEEALLVPPAVPKP